MQNLIKKIKRKTNGAIVQLIFSGLILVMLAVLIVWTDFVLRLIIGLLVVVMAYVCFHFAYKIWWVKKEIEKHFKI